MLFDLHSPIGEGAQVNIRNAGLLLRAARERNDGDTSSSLQHNLFFFLDQTAFDHGMRRRALHQEEIRWIMPACDSEAQTACCGNPKGLAFWIAGVARVHDAGRAGRDHLEE